MFLTDRGDGITEVMVEYVIEKCIRYIKGVLIITLKDLEEELID